LSALNASFLSDLLFSGWPQLWPDRINLDAVWFDLILASCYPTLVAAYLWWRSHL
jgi:hypothetical protein